MKLDVRMKLERGMGRRCRERHPAHLLVCEELEYHEGNCNAIQPGSSEFGGERVEWRRRSLTLMLDEQQEAA